MGSAPIVESRQDVVAGRYERRGPIERVHGHPGSARVPRQERGCDPDTAATICSSPVVSAITHLLEQVRKVRLDRPRPGLRAADAMSREADDGDKPSPAVSSRSASGSMRQLEEHGAHVVELVQNLYRVFVVLSHVALRDRDPQR